MDAKGNIGPYQASVIATACIALREFMRIDRYLRDHPLPDETVSIDQWAMLTGRVLRHKESVDRSLAKLGLDAAKDPLTDAIHRSTEALIARLDAGQDEPNDAEDEPLGGEEQSTQEGPSSHD